jgi:hypothetical protein
MRGAGGERRGVDTYIVLQGKDLPEVTSRSCDDNIKQLLLRKRMRM